MEIFVVAIIGYLVIGVWSISLAIRLDRCRKVLEQSETELAWWKQGLQPPF